MKNQLIHKLPMKKAVIILSVLFLGACSSKQDAESIRKQINDYKKEVADINSKVSALEKKLKAMDQDEPDAFIVPVRVKEMEPSTFRHYIQVSGSAEAVKEAFISSETSGQIENIYVKEGDYVNKGQLLADLNTDVLDNSISELKSNLELAKTVFEKQSRLWKQGIGSELQYLNAKNNKESLEKKLCVRLVAYEGHS